MITEKNSFPSLRVAIVLFIIFWGLYLSLGFTLASVHAFAQSDILFNADNMRYIQILNEGTQKAAPYTKHPLLFLFLKPVVDGLFKVTGSETTAVLLINSAFGGLAVAIACLFFQKIGLKTFQAILYSIVLGLSASYLFFSAAPESFIVSAAAITLLYLLFLLQPGNLLYFIPVGVFTLGVTVTNFAQSLIIYSLSLWQDQWQDKWINRFKKVGFFLIGVLSCTTILSVVQKIIYPIMLKRSIFPLSLLIHQTLSSEVEKHGFEPTHGQDVFWRVANLFDYLFVSNLIAPKIQVFDHTVKNPPNWLNLAKSPGPWVSFYTLPIPEFNTTGIIGAWLWISILCLSCYASIKFASYQFPIIKSFILCFIFNFLLHMVYGGEHEFFLYTPHWTFTVVAWAAFLLHQFQHEKPRLAPFLNGLLIAFIVTQILNNFYFFYRLVSIYSHS
jgi:hypothetical protein